MWINVWIQDRTEWFFYHRQTEQSSAEPNMMLLSGELNGKNDSVGEGVRSLSALLVISVWSTWLWHEDVVCLLSVTYASWLNRGEPVVPLDKAMKSFYRLSFIVTIHVAVSSGLATIFNTKYMYLPAAITRVRRIPVF